jgi:hypothetical protein
MSPTEAVVRNPIRAIEYKPQFVGQQEFGYFLFSRDSGATEGPRSRRPFRSLLPSVNCD